MQACTIDGMSFYLRGSHALSAQRVQKMKSRGPKDRQLEYDVFLKEQGFLYLQWVPDVGEKVDIGKAVNFKHLHIDQS